MIGIKDEIETYGNEGEEIDNIFDRCCKHVIQYWI